MTTSLSDSSRFISISENIKVIRDEISESAVKSGRKPDEVKLMAVTKTVDPIYINFAIEECGIDLIGENKVIKTKYVQVEANVIDIKMEE